MKNLLLFIFILFIYQNSSAQNNEDFEDASLIFPTPPASITVTTPSAINGWTVNGGSNSGWGSTGNCTNTTAITGNPNACILLSPGASGYVDPIIGASYPIYSVFGGTATSYPAASVANGIQCFGDWFIKINDQNPGSSVNRLSKTINVTPTNCIFNFAFINVLEQGNCCCDNPGFSLKAKIMGSGCTSIVSTTSCPQFTAAAAPMSWCTSTIACGANFNTSSYLNASATGWVFNKWQKGTLGLASFIGSCVMIEITAFDDPYSTYAGYTYFDAQTSPMDIIFNGTPWSITSSTTNVSSCSTANGYTITAPSVVGGYTWTAPGPYTITPGSGGQQISISTSGTYTLTMNPPGSFSPIIKILNVVFSSPPNLAITSVTQASCTNSLNAISLNFANGTPNSSITPNYFVTFSPTMPTGTTSVTSNSATYTGLAVGINTITITDSVNCISQNTINITSNPCTGLKETEWNKNISVAPNPNNGKFIVMINSKIDSAEIRVTNDRTGSA